MGNHSYTVGVRWTGNMGQGTLDYRAYERAHVISSKGKPELLGSSDPMFRGDTTKYNPEELLLAALSACHMLWYLHLCADRKILVTAYEDNPTAIMKVESDGGGKFTEATLRPSVVITDQARLEEAAELHKSAHEKCFIARSVNFPTKIEPTIKF
jgi:organic hydroperoxide reductase OsmC/OhrA